MRLSIVAIVFSIAVCECSDKVIVGYLPNDISTIENVPFNKYTHINYASAFLNNRDNLPSFSNISKVESILPNIINYAHGNNTKVLLSIGGWTGSQQFSSMVASGVSRENFIKWNLDFIEKYGTDGIDIDWEHPNKQTAGCNLFDEKDTDNYLLLLKELRKALDTKFPNNYKEVSLAVHPQPFIKSGVPMTDVKEYVPYFDRIQLLTFDVNGAWSPTTGPNAPFINQQGKGAPISFVGAIREWREAGVPSKKIAAGLAFYGRTSKVKADMTVDQKQYQRSRIGAPKGDIDDSKFFDPYCSNSTTKGYNGIWKWKNLRKQGVLKKDGVTPGKDWKRFWDPISKTPWLFDSSKKTFISYDDARSIEIKIRHVLCEGLGGVMVRNIDYDNGELIKVVHKIHNADSLPCEQVIILKDDSLNDVKDNDLINTVDVPSTLIDDLGNLVEPATTSVDIIGFAEETIGSDKINDDFDEDFDYIDVDETTSKVVLETSKSAPTSSDFSTSTSSSIKPVRTHVAQVGVGNPCDLKGEKLCVSLGTSNEWLSCDVDKWVSNKCETGLVCNENRAGVYCDYPEESSRNIAAEVSAVVRYEFDHDLSSVSSFKTPDYLKHRATLPYVHPVTIYEV